METTFEKYRKLFALIVTGAVVYVLQLYGMQPSDLQIYELTLPAVVGPIVDFIVTFGLPAAFMAAAPMGKYIGSHWIVQYWQWWVGGVALVVALAFGVTMVGGLFAWTG